MDDQDRIVVGVDGSPSSRQALRWAARQAALTGGTVPALTSSLGWLPPSSGDEEALEARAREDLTPCVEETLGAHPSADVRTKVRYGTPASVLLRAARDASLLVVGSRGLGGFAGLLLGSVAQHCVQHAACPVVVVREDALTGVGEGA
ncbi:universal stress protein [Streptomyces pseudogriseolus]|uniref:universal stress protein n=1 Tax=Streptomyces pseudogriseolus TaxID=36817 RepID=UPI00349B92F1